MDLIERTSPINTTPYVSNYNNYMPRKIKTTYNLKYAEYLEKHSMSVFPRSICSWTGVNNISRILRKFGAYLNTHG